MFHIKDVDIELFMWTFNSARQSVLQHDIYQLDFTLLLSLGEDGVEQ